MDNVVASFLVLLLTGSLAFLITFAVWILALKRIAKRQDRELLQEVWGRLAKEPESRTGPG